MNLAIIIGVAKYNRPGCDLPACSNDIKLIRTLLDQSGKYNELIEIATESSSVAVKGALASFVKKHQGNKIDELFFYFTGHGGLFDEHFHFLLSDYDESKKKATSLSNDELDQMLRSLAPSLTIKVVDACHSGVAYIKDPDTLAKSLESSKRNFSNCYFMFSSQSNQSSYQDNRLSAFTEVFVDACLSIGAGAGAGAGDVRYKDIMDSLADHFSNSGTQQPLFITQATFTEVFFKIDQSGRDALTSVAASFQRPPGSEPNLGTPRELAGEEIKEPSLLSLVKSQAQQYCTQDEVLVYLRGLEGQIGTAKLSGDLAELYELSSEFSPADYGHFYISNRSSLGKWLKDNRGDYFAKPTYSTQEYEEDVLDLKAASLTMSQFGIDIPKKKVRKNREVLTGFSLTAQVPYREAKITARPLYQNIPYIICVFTFVFSKKEIALFSCVHSVAESDWGKLFDIDDPNWGYTIFIIKEDLDATKTAKFLLSKIQEFTEQVVRKKLGLAKDEPEAKQGAKPAGK